MSELSIRFSSENETSPISISLFRPDAGTLTNPVSFMPPLTDKQLADLRWYLEDYSFWPSGPDYKRAERIENDFENWGRALRDSVLKSNDAARLWQQFVDGMGRGDPAWSPNGQGDHTGSPNLQGNHPGLPLQPIVTIDATDPRVLRLPWELLADDGGHIFARGIGVRRRLQNATTAPVKSFELPVRILVVTSRPTDAPFIDPRAVSRPLLDAVDELGDRVAVEFLYPPTLDALTTRLRDRNAPPVHVVHFDGHGVYDENIGLGYLLFEDDAHKGDRVDANRLGTLLFNCGIPLMVLNACQSAAQKDANPYACVAARLIRAGVGSVLAMNYSVLVVAARKFVAAFYGGLADGLTIGQAVDAGRFKLLSDEKRHTLTRTNEKGEAVEETIRLRDWFLPALYQQSVDPVVFANVGATLGGRPGQGGQPPRQDGQPPRQDGQPHRVAPTPADLPAEPLHGFHGRAREMLNIERAFADHAVVVLHGFGGIGKTALATEAGRWFQRTGRFAGGAAFVSFEFGGSLQQLCSWVGQTISRDKDFVIGEGDPVQRIADLLREKPALVILDNFESVLGNAPLMPAEELKAILDAVGLWGQGDTVTRRQGDAGSRILITTRDVSFNDARFAPSKHCAHIELGGLAEQDALDLAAAILNDNGIDRAKVNRQELTDLMERLGGHPLSLYLVLPQLSAHTPAEISARFEQLLPGFTQGKAKERNESLAVSLEFSLRRLGEQTRAALPDLAVFQGGAMENMILAITQMDAELWKTARAEMQAASLVKVEDLPNIKFPFLRFHPTLLPYLSTQLATARRTELETRYWQAYYDFANYLVQSDTQHPIEARAMAVREMPNLRRALDLALAADAMDEAVEFADDIARFLDYFGRWRERDEMLEQVKREKLKVKSADGKLTKADYLMESQRGEVLWQQGHAAEAERVFRELLKRMDAGVAYDMDYVRACTLMRLGRCLAAQGKPTQAIEWHRQALQAFERLSATNKDAKKMIAAVRTDLADNLAATGKFDEAESQYESALKVAREVDDSRQIGVDLGQLGTLAMQRGDLKTAHERYTEALQTFRAMGEQQSEAVIWHQLGMVAQKAEQWDEAEKYYREAVRIREQIRDLPELAKSFNQLALIAEGAGRLADAEQWYLRAIELDEKLGNQEGVSQGYSNLANLYLSQHRLDEAERYARRAVETFEHANVETGMWKIYNILAKIADARGNTAEAAQWRRKEQDSFAAYAGAAYQLPQWARQFINAVSVAIHGGQLDSETEKFLMQLENSDWRNLASAVRRILNGETDFEKLRGELDYDEAYIVRAILEAKDEGGRQKDESGQQQPSQDTARSQQGITLDQLLQYVVAECKPDAPAGLAEQMHALTRQLGTNANAPAELCTLGNILNAILSGERNPNLAGLPPQLAEAVTKMLAELKS